MRQQTHRDMLAVFAAALCLISASHSAPLACEDLLRPLDQVDPHGYAGRWALVTGSLNDSRSAEIFKQRDSFTIDFNNGSLVQASRFGDVCKYESLNISMKGHTLNLSVGTWNLTGTFFHTSCPDCAVLSWDRESPHHKSLDLYLFSRRREVTQKEMEDFSAQVDCLNMPPPIVMDSTKDLCPEVRLESV